MRAVPLLLLATLLTGAEPPNFEREIAPILEASCLSCHDAHHAKGDLRLDTRQHALKALTPDAGGAVLLLEQISGPEPEMPKKAKPLGARQVELIRRWLAAGAAWPEQRVLQNNPVRDLDWWSLKPLGAGSPPRPGHPVDAFVQAKLDEQKLRPVPEAPLLVLARRLTFDLTGLPPTPEQLAAATRDGYERYVDSLLANPAFGEKWARHWLDVARYAESHGYDKDKVRANAWPYRDYVIRAFNEDKPYDRFAQEQIAGDALYPHTRDGVVGLGFLAAGPWDLIGHSEVGEAKVDGRIAKHLDRDEMLGAVFNVFAATTVQCAQCHHHKFDPIRSDDYYRLHAVFAAVDRAERRYETGGSERARLVAERDRLLAELAASDREAEEGLRPRTAALDAEIARLQQAHALSAQPQSGWHGEIRAVDDDATWVQVDLGAARPVALVRLIPAFDDYANIGKGFGFPVRYRVEAADDEGFRSGVRTLLDATGSDQPNPLDRPVAIPVGDAPLRFIRVTITRLAKRSGDYIAAFAELEALGPDGRNLARGTAVSARDSIEVAPRWGRVNLTDGIYPGALADEHAAEVQRLAVRRAGIAEATRTSAGDARRQALIARIAAGTRSIDALGGGGVVFAASTTFPAQDKFVATGGKPRAIHLLHRGDIRSPGPALSAGMPPLWPGAVAEFPLPADAPESAARAALATAIAGRDNPLFWRVIANRLWQWTMGDPLVGTPNDFGRMGLAPSHPELLDWLAATLRDDPRHSLKAVIRLLVTSAAYRRASDDLPQNSRRDAGNRWRWRANRRRLGAEEFRDAALAVSGRLRLDARGGPGFADFVIVKPEQSPHYEYGLHDPDDVASHRRSIYRQVIRSQPQPLLTILDCADPSLSVPRRDESTTALQALAQWNNRFVEAMARSFARRIEAMDGDRLGQACTLTLGRGPDAEERAVLAEHLQRFGAASLARVLFNLNGFTYVD